MRSIALSILLSLAVVDWTAAADWPSWRGPLGNGVSPEPGLPSTWSTQDGIAWSVPLAGPGVSSPVTAGDRVYVTSQIGRGALKPGEHPLLARTDPEVAKAERAMPDPGGASAPSTGGAAAVFVDRGVRPLDRPAPLGAPPAGRGAAAAGAREAQPGDAEPGHRRRAGLRLVRHRAVGGARPSTASASGNAISPRRTDRSRSTGGTAARPRCTAICSICCATTSRRRICWRSTSAAA